MQELGDTLVSYYRATTAPSYRMFGTLGAPIGNTGLRSNGTLVMRPISEGEI